MATIINKMSMKTVVGSPKNIRECADGPIVRVMGKVTGKKTGEGDNGPWVGFTGQFEGTNLSTGEVFHAGKCFLPGCASDLIEAAFNANPEGELMFAFDIIKTEDATSSVGYTYSARPLVEAAPESDPFAALRGGLPALPAPAEKEAKKK